jgi:hypothetical protein
VTPPKVKVPVPAVALTPDHAAAALDVGRTFFDENIAPDLKAIRLGAKVLYPVSELERWATEQAHPTLRKAA